MYIVIYILSKTNNERKLEKILKNMNKTIARRKHPKIPDFPKLLD